MDKIKFSGQVILICVLSLLLVACSAASTPTPLPEQPFVVTMDGKTCTYTGPIELPTGEYEFVVKNSTDLSWEIFIVRLINDHTYQELLGKQSEPGGPIDIDETWTEEAMKNLTGWDEEDNYIYRFSFSKEGEYSTVVADPELVSIWICGPINIIASTSE
jgi:hypothetical protein